jgi:glycosyltransferase involved in cell wall biosynthesis
MPTQQTPLVSILTPSFNQAAWLGDNLRSVACQTYPRIEHIVMDGGSTDGTVEVLRAAGDSVRWRSEPDQGQSDAINKAFRESTGDIIGWINSDDAYFDCTVVEDVVAYFVAHPDVDVVFGHCVQVTEDGHIIQVLWAPEYDPELMKAVNGFMQPSTFLRRSALSEPLLDVTFHFAMDYELWLRLDSQGSTFHRIDRITAIDRHQASRKSSTIKHVNDADLLRLEQMYGLDLSPANDRMRSGYYRGQRIMGAFLIPRIKRDRLAFTAPADLKRGLWRRQIGSRRSTWSEEYR